MMFIQLIAKTESIEVEPVPVSIDRTSRIDSLPDWILRGMVNSGSKGQNMCKLATVIGLLIAWRGLEEWSERDGYFQDGSFVVCLYL